MSGKKLQAESFRIFNNDWALLTAGAPEDYNTMTISWGGLGTLWGKDVATVYVRPNRHTFGYLNESEYFTLTFFPEEYRKDLTLLGTLSGRDGDKVAQTGLTARACPHGTVGFAQATLTLVCRKLYWQDMDDSQIPREVKETFYGREPVHRLYIAEVVEILR